MMEYKKQFKEARPETIGETDPAFDMSNYIDWIDEKYESLTKENERLREENKENDRCRVLQLNSFSIENTQLKAENEELKADARVFVGLAISMAERAGYDTSQYEKFQEKITPKN